MSARATSTVDQVHISTLDTSGNIKGYTQRIYSTSKKHTSPDINHHWSTRGTMRGCIFWPRRSTPQRSFQKQPWLRKLEHISSLSKRAFGDPHFFFGARGHQPSWCPGGCTSIISGHGPIGLWTNIAYNVEMALCNLSQYNSLLWGARHIPFYGVLMTHRAPKDASIS